MMLSLHFFRGDVARAQQRKLTSLLMVVGLGLISTSCFHWIFADKSDPTVWGISGNDGQVMLKLSGQKITGEFLDPSGRALAGIEAGAITDGSDVTCVSGTDPGNGYEMGIYCDSASRFQPWFLWEGEGLTAGPEQVASGVAPGRFSDNRVRFNLQRVSGFDRMEQVRSAQVGSHLDRLAGLVFKISNNSNRFSQRDFSVTSKTGEPLESIATRANRNQVLVHFIDRTGTVVDAWFYQVSQSSARLKSSLVRNLKSALRALGVAVNDGDRVDVIAVNGLFNHHPDILQVARTAEALPDLRPRISGEDRLARGESLRGRISIQIHNDGTADAVGTTFSDSGYVVDLVLSTDSELPVRLAPGGSTYRDDGLIINGRANRTDTIPPGRFGTVGGSAFIPQDTPPGRYCLGVVVDPARKLAELRESNNTTCHWITVTAPSPFVFDRHAP